MRLLFVTQAIDLDEPVLSTYHDWVAMLAGQVEQVEAVCLKEGRHILPANVRVHSLGKEAGRKSPFLYALRFFHLSWKLRGEYDAVFVHMNQEYILISGLLWKLLGKRVYLWRNHYAGSWLTDIAAMFCTKVFCTSKHSYTARLKKTVLMPVGVDTDRFVPAVAKPAPRSILFFARMAPSKRPDLLIDALGLLAHRGVTFTASFVGSPLSKDEAYYAGLKEQVRSLGLSDRVMFHPGVSNEEAPRIFHEYELFVNCSPSGMFDKMLFEAAASGCLVLAQSADFASLMGPVAAFDGSTEDLANKLETLLALPGEKKEELSRQFVERARTHDVASLGKRIRYEIEPVRPSFAKRFLPILLSVALVVHILSAVGVATLRPESISTTPDPLDYRLAALNLIEHRAFTLAPPEASAPELLRTPGYPLFLAGTYMLDGKTGILIVLLQSGMLILMGWLLFMLLRAFAIGERTAFAFVTLYLFEPLQWLYTLHTMTETVTSLLLLGLVTLAYCGRGVTTWGRAAAFGLGTGLLVLVKPSALMWLPFLLFILVISSSKSRIIKLGIAVTCVALVLAPWMARNYLLVGEPILSSSSAFNLVRGLGNREEGSSLGGIIARISDHGHAYTVHAGFTAPGYASVKEGYAHLVAREGIGVLAVRQLACAPKVWFGHEYALIAGLALGAHQPPAALVEMVDTVLWALVLALALVGASTLVYNPGTRWRILPLLGMLVAAIALNACLSWSRMLIPLYSVISLCAAAGVHFLLRSR